MNVVRLRFRLEIQRIPGFGYLVLAARSEKVLVEFQTSLSYPATQRSAAHTVSASPPPPSTACTDDADDLAPVLVVGVTVLVVTDQERQTYTRSMFAWTAGLR